MMVLDERILKIISYSAISWTHKCKMHTNWHFSEHRLNPLSQLQLRSMVAMHVPGCLKQMDPMGQKENPKGDQRGPQVFAYVSFNQ